MLFGDLGQRGWLPFGLLILVDEQGAHTLLEVGAWLQVAHGQTIFHDQALGQRKLGSQLQLTECYLQRGGRDFAKDLKINK